jgi:hypothetical protein
VPDKRSRTFRETRRYLNELLSRKLIKIDYKNRFYLTSKGLKVWEEERILYALSVDTASY